MRIEDQIDSVLVPKWAARKQIVFLRLFWAYLKETGGATPHFRIGLAQQVDLLRCGLGLDVLEDPLDGALGFDPNRLTDG